MKILAFETSCDDTSIALFENERVIQMYTKSQIKIHNKTWGVVPEIASREHANVIFEVLDAVLVDGNASLNDIDYIAVTNHPGLIPSLLTWITVASTLSQTLSIPIIPIDHIEAHIFSNWLERAESEIPFPLVCLTVSGGHNELWYMSDMWTREKLGQTQDDAAGEAFDKVAKMMELWYPWWPIVSRLAEEYKISHPQAFPSNWRKGSNNELFPRVFLEKTGFWFSFSGLKSAVKREVDKRWKLTIHDQRELSHEFQSAVNEVLCFKLLEAARQKWVATVLLAGWVSANDDLNARILEESKKLSLKFFTPIKKLYCMDNAAMIGILAYYRVKYGQFEEKVGVVEVGRY